MKRLFIISAVIIGFGTLSACRKLDKVTAVTVNFSMNQPTENANIAFGQNLHIQGTITGTAELHGYLIELIDKADGSVVYTFASSTHDSEYYFHEHFMNSVSQTTDYTLRIEVNLDHYSVETKSKEMNVTFVQE